MCDRLIDKWIRMATLFDENEKNMTETVKHTQFNIVSLNNKLKEFEEIGMITTRKENKCCYIKLTQKGIFIKHHLLEIRRLLENNGN